MRFARVHKIAAYLLAVLGLVALTTGGELGGVATVALVLGLIASWFAEGPLLEDVRYVRSWNTLVVLVLALEIARTVFFRLSPLTAAVEFAALLQLSRLASRRTARDYQQITVLAMLHLIAATVLGGGLSYAACFVGFVIVTPWAMTLGHLRREIEGNYLADARAGRSGVPIDVARILRSRRVVGPGLLVGSSLLSIPVFAMTAVIFVLFPRIGLGIFSVRPNRANQVTGLGDHVDLTGHGTIRDDPTIVLRIEPADLPASPPQLRTFRLRGAAFDRYEGRTWTRSNSRRDAIPRDQFYFLHPVRRASDWRSFRIVIDSLEPPVVLLPVDERGTTVALQVEPRIEAGIPRYPELTSDPADEVRYVSNDDLGLVYTAFVSSSALPELLEGSARARYLATPVDLPARIAALAHQITDEQPTTVARALAVQDYLRHFRYTLELESGGAAQPLDDFLFRTRAGHCEYFSTAMAVMLRTVGVPTRNVTGFLGGSYNRYGRFYAVRQGDAHSWVEVYDDRRGWLTFDPTPPAREVGPLRAGGFNELDAFVEAMRVRWRRYIVSFDLGTQARMASQLYRLFHGTSRRGVDRSEGPAVNRSAQWSALVTRARPYVPLVVGLGAIAALAFVWRRRRVVPSALAGLDPSRVNQVRDALVLARALDSTLTTRGRPRPRTVSPVGFAADLARRGDPLADLAVRVAARYADARFGERPLGAAELDQLRRELRDAPDAAPP
ncbi:MAG: transglutaminaseTgpA domain-containing protein [Deltaproteobacteria bacterium]